MASLKFSVHTQGLEEIAYRLRDNVPKAEHIVAEQIQKDTEPYVPALTLSLSNRTQVRGNAIIYPPPYARYLYYGKVMVDRATGKGPMHFVDKNGNEVIRFRKGAKLKPIDKDLNIQQSVHKNAQSHWFEASKAQNLDKWIETAQKAVTKFGDK